MSPEDAGVRPAGKQLGVDTSRDRLASDGVSSMRRTGGQGGSRLQPDVDAAELACDFEEVVRPFQPATVDDERRASGVELEATERAGGPRRNVSDDGPLARRDRVARLVAVASWPEQDHERRRARLAAD